MYPFRTRFSKDILTEFFPPTRKTKRTRVVILCDGMPSMPIKKDLLEFLSRKGYWVFYPRYRGSWESGGLFFAKSPDLDIIDVIEGLSKEFSESYAGQKFRLKPDEIILVASSFGGAAALLASRDSRVTKVVAFSSLVDWTAKSDEPFDFMERFVPEAFGMGYRISKNGWQKVKSGQFFNPVTHVKEIVGKKTLMIHAQDDTVVFWKPVQKFAKQVGADLWLLKKGDHMGLSTIMKNRFWKRAVKFLK